MTAYQDHHVAYFKVRYMGMQFLSVACAVWGCHTSYLVNKSNYLNYFLGRSTKEWIMDLKFVAVPVNDR